MVLNLIPTPIDKIIKDRTDRHIVVARFAPLVDAMRGIVNEIITDMSDLKVGPEVLAPWQDAIRELIVHRLTQSTSRFIRIVDLED